MRLLALGVSLLLACASARAPASAVQDYTYDAELGGDELVVRAEFPPGDARELSLDFEAMRFVRNMEVDIGQGWVRATALPACNVCRVRYRFDLARAADVTDDEDIARREGGAFVGAPSAWLVYPERVVAGARVRYRVRGAKFLSGHAKSGDEWVVDATQFAHSPTAIIGEFDSFRVGALDVAMKPQTFDERAIAAWTRLGTDAISSYYGAFPVDRALLVLFARDHGDVGFGRTTGNGGASIAVDVGRSVDLDALASDWVLVHELAHLAFPRVPRKHRWAEEGMATYVEPIARARLHQITPNRVWRDLVEGLPHGLPRAGDQGLDRTHTWGRTYWGGALFWLLADVDIRVRTRGEKSLDDALRAIRAAGGDVRRTWPMEKVLDIGDAATGTDALRALYGRMAEAPMDVDLDALWQKLGVQYDGAHVTFDDSAPLAKVRRSIAG